MSPKRLLFVVSIVLLIGCMPSVASPGAPAGNTAAPVAEATAETIPTTGLAVQPVSNNQVEGCVTEYDEAVDYFPDKVTLQEAVGFQVEYFNNYKVVTVLTPYRDAEETFQYLLVQCGTPTPSGYEDALTLEVPIQSIISLSNRYLPSLRVLDQLDKLVGVDSIEGIYDPQVLQLAEAGTITAVGLGADVNVEQVIALEPDLVMAFAGVQAEANAHPKLLEAGVNVAINAEYMENTALGRAEWLKYVALFFNQEAKATEYFDGTLNRYQELAALASAAENKPTVLWGLPGKDTWFMPGGNGFVARLLEDAGASYPWSDDTSTGIMPLAFEAVFERAGDADYWLAADGYPSMDEMLAADARLAELGPVKNDTVWANDARINDTFGNDYWESGIIDADVVLADFIAIFHPELLTDHEPVFWRPFE